MITAKKFRTKTGYCHILPDRIVFTHRGFLGRLGDMIIEGKMSRMLILFGSLALLVFYFAYRTNEKGEGMWAFLFVLIGLYMVYAIFKNARHSTHPIILRNQITEIALLDEVKGISPPGFEIEFKNATGKLRKRIISLPGRFSKYPEEMKEAKKLLRDEGLLH
jgi:hypothetical protein